MNPLAKFTNDEIETRLKTLVFKERQLLHIILEHIKEVDSRKLYLARAYSSLYEYLTKELQYSGSAAMRRIEAARLLKEVPAISEKIQDDSLNLTQIGELSRAVKEKEKATGAKVSALQKESLLERISSKTSHETQKELSQALDLQLKDYDFQRVQKDESVRLETTLSKEQFEMLMKCRDLASHSLSQNHLSSDWADVLEVIMNYYLKEKGNALSEVFNSDLKKVILNNLEKEHKDGVADEQITTAPVVAMHHNKTLTPKTRQEIFKRDQFCRYKDSKTGRICGSTYALQVDHKVPRWAKGDHSHDNLQILCGAHNRWKYRKEMRLVYK